jgi:hypothetical protein
MGQPAVIDLVFGSMSGASGEQLSRLLAPLGQVLDAVLHGDRGGQRLEEPSSPDDSPPVAVVVEATPSHGEAAADPEPRGWLRMVGLAVAAVGAGALFAYHGAGRRFGRQRMAGPRERVRCQRPV